MPSHTTERKRIEDAKRRIREAVPTLPLPRSAPAPLRIPNLILRGVETIGQGLVELDPLNIITDTPNVIPNRPEQGPRAPSVAERMMMSMVNDPDFIMTPTDVATINDPSRMMVDTGNGMMVIDGQTSTQFRRDNLLPRTRGRKKTKTDKTMSKALAQANKELRKKNGQLRRGVTQADIMRRAHRLRRKMS